MIQINRNDSSYSQAVNCEHTSYYNPPTTISVNGTKFILSVGSSDSITVKHKPKSDIVLVIAYNFGLDYASLEEIDLTTKFVNSAYLDNITRDYPKFFDFTYKYQIKCLAPHLSY